MKNEVTVVTTLACILGTHNQGRKRAQEHCRLLLDRLLSVVFACSNAVSRRIAFMTHMLALQFLVSGLKYYV